MGYFPSADPAQAGRIVLLDEVQVAVDTATVTFDNIPEGYGALWISGMLGGPGTCEMRVGSGGVVDTGASYRYAANLDGSSEATDEADAGTVAANAFGRASIAHTAGYFSPVEMLLPGYARAGTFKPWIARSGGMRSSTEDRHGQAGGIWLNNVDPIDIITVGDITGGGGGGNIAAGSFLRLYGVATDPIVSTLLSGDAPLAVSAGEAYESWPVILRNPSNDDLIVLYGSGTQHNPTTSRVVKQQVSVNDGATYGVDSTIVDTAYDNAIFGAGIDSAGDLIAWIRQRTSGGSVARYPLFRSTDDGATWTEVVAPAHSPMPGVIGPIISVPTVGLLCAWQGSSVGSSWGILTSDDDGATWTQTTVESGLSTATWPAEIRFLDLGSGKILGIGRTESVGNPLFQLESDDYGATWTKANSNIDDQQQSPAALLLDGTDIHLYYYARGDGVLRHRVTDEATIWGNPTAWPAAENLATGSTNVSDSGYAHAVIDALGQHQVAYYDRVGTNRTQIKQYTNTP